MLVLGGSWEALERVLRQAGYFTHRPTLRAGWR
jgi:hypothetical protein